MKGVTWKLPLEKQAKLMEQFGEAVEVLEGAPTQSLYGTSAFIRVRRSGVRSA
jgi:hypothetical protein